MALVVGTNAGFVEVAPTSDPDGSFTTLPKDARSVSFKVTAPIGATKVTEIGWYTGNATEEANFEVAIYNHDSGNNVPEDIIGSSTTNAKGTNAGWKVATGLDISITEGVIYWIAAQLDNTATTTNIDASGTGTGNRYLNDPPGGSTTLPDPWPNSGASTGTRIIAIYALVETAAPSTINPKIKISGTFSTKPIKVKIGGTFVEKTLKVKVGGTFQ